MHEYQLTVPHEFGAFHLAIHLTIMHMQGGEEPVFKSKETEVATIYLIPFDEEDTMYVFDKYLRENMSFLFQ